MADFSWLFLSTFFLSNSNQRVLRTDTSIRKQLTSGKTAASFLGNISSFTQIALSLSLREAFLRLMTVVITSHYLQPEIIITRVTLKRVRWKVSISRSMFETRTLIDERDLTAAEISYRFYFWNWPCKMKGRLVLRCILSSPSFRSWMPSGRLNRRDARHAGKQLTCTFSLEEQLVGQSTSQEPSAFLIPGVPFIDP